MSRRRQRARRVDDVVDDDRRLAPHITDDIADLGNLMRRPLLRQQRQIRPDLLGKLLVELRAPDVRGDDHQVRELLVGEVFGQHEERRHVIDRLLEEALDLAGMEIHRQNAVGAGDLEHPRHEPRGNRLARLGLLVLARIPEPRGDGDHPVRGGADGGVDHHQQFHQRIVGGDAGRGVAARGLHDEHIRATNRLVVAAVDLPVGEGLHGDGAQIDAQLAGDVVGQLRIGAAGEEHQPLAVVDWDACGRSPRVQRAHRKQESSPPGVPTYVRCSARYCAGARERRREHRRGCPA